jgi:hypothetical protein
LKREKIHFPDVGDFAGMHKEPWIVWERPDFAKQATSRSRLFPLQANGLQGLLLAAQGHKPQSGGCGQTARNAIFFVFDQRRKTMFANMSKKCAALAVGLAVSMPVFAVDAKPIEDLNTFEQQFVSCIMKKGNNACLKDTFANRLPYDKDGFVNKINTSLTSNLQKCNPYKVHPMPKISRGDLYEGRPYIIECSNNSLIGVYMYFFHIQEKWFLFSLDIHGDDDFVSQVLGIQNAPVWHKK